jgi:dephospho-CoA kinase
MDKKVIIGVTGTISGGKDAVAEYICGKYNLKNYSLSDTIRAEATKRGQDHSRETLFALGNELRAGFGPEELAKRVLGLINERVAVVTSIRNLGEVAYFKENTNFYFISVDAPIELRYQRSIDRNRAGDSKTFEDFKDAEEKEMAGDKTKQQLVACMRAGDFFVINDGTLEKLYDRVDEIMKSILLSANKELEKN